jgi:membrane-associated phospholipid phosphatase
MTRFEDWISQDLRSIDHELYVWASNLVSKTDGITGLFFKWSNSNQGTWALGLVALCFAIAVHLHEKRTRNSGSPRSWLVFVMGVVIIVTWMAMADGLAHALKEWFGRPKPHVLNPVFGTKFPLSFPSNHATNMLTLAWLLRPLLFSRKEIYGPVMWVLLLSFAVLVACSRVLFGEHYPLDVLFGSLLGTAWGITGSCVLLWALRKINTSPKL